MNNITFVVREEDMNEFRYYLQERENSEATIEKYIRDGSAGGQGKTVGIQGMADRELRGQQCEFHACGAESVSGISGERQAASQTDQSPADGYAVHGQDP